MGVLQATTGDQYVLLPETSIGRAKKNDLPLPGKDVSTQQAAFRWTGEHWQVEDLGSKNGTMVDGRVLSQGQRAALTQGSTLVFAEEQVWTLIDGGAPQFPMAVPLAGGSPIQADAGVLALPGEGFDEVHITRLGDAVMLADNALEHEEVVVAGGRSFRILLR